MLPIWGSLMSDKKRNAATRSIVRMTATEMGIRNTALQVLWLLTDCIGYSTGTARISRDVCMAKLGRCEKTIKIAFRDLRRIGIIYPVAYAGGGHRRSPVYRFRMHETALMAFNEDRRAHKYMPEDPADIILNNGGEILQQRGRKIPPHPKKSSIIKEAPPSAALIRATIAVSAGIKWVLRGRIKSGGIVCQHCCEQ